MEAEGAFGGPELLGCLMQQHAGPPNNMGGGWSLQHQSAMLKHLVGTTGGPSADGGFDTFLGSMDFSTELSALTGGAGDSTLLGGAPVLDPASFFQPPTPPVSPPENSLGSGSEEESKAPSMPGVCLVCCVPSCGSCGPCRPTRDGSLLYQSHPADVTVRGALLTPSETAYNPLLVPANPAPSHLFPLQLPPPPSAPASPQANAPLQHAIQPGAATAAAAGGQAPERRAKKMQHNAVERKYRNSINSRLEELKALLPTRVGDRATAVSQKMNKASILAKAIEHITKLCEDKKALEAENQLLRSKLSAANGTGAQPSKEKPSHVRCKSPMQSSSDEEEATSCGSYSPASSPEAVAAASAARVKAAAKDEAPSAASSPGVRPASPKSSSGKPAASVEHVAKKRKAPPQEYSRLLMAVGLLGFCVFGTPAWISGPGDAVVVGSAPGHHTSRTLTSTDAAGVAVDAAAFAAQAFAILVSGWLWWWVARVALFVAALSMIFKQEALETEPAKTRAAAQHEKKSAAILANGDHQAAQWHAVQALLFLGRPQATSTAGFTYTLFWEIACQLFHRMAVYWPLNLLLFRSPPVAGASIEVAVRATHRLHQLLLRRRASSGGIGVLESSRLAALQAVNLCESSSVDLDPELRIRVYVAAAAQSILSSGTGAWLAHTYLRQAQKVYRSSAHDVDTPNPLSWVFHEDGHQFFQSGRWIQERMVTSRGQTLAPGEMEQIGQSYRQHTLAGCVRALVKGKDPELVAERLGDLFQHSVNADDLQTAWWSMVILTIVHWRQSRPADARGCLVEVELLGLELSRVQAAVHSTCVAHQALLDGDQPLCWVASERAARLLEKPGNLGGVHGADSLTRNVVFIAFRQLLACRLALYRQRSYLEKQGLEVPPLASIEGVALSRQDLLDSFHRDITSMSDFGEQHPVAQPLVLMYQAVHRCLVGGQPRPTELLFHQAIKLAKRQSLYFDHASVLLHMCGYLQTVLTASFMRERLQLVRSVVLFASACPSLAPAPSPCSRVLLPVGRHCNRRRGFSSGWTLPKSWRPRRKCSVCWATRERFLVGNVAWSDLTAPSRLTSASKGCMPRPLSLHIPSTYAIQRCDYDGCCSLPAARVDLIITLLRPGRRCLLG